MLQLCNQLESGQVSQNNDDDFDQPVDFDAGNDRTPPYQRQRSNIAPARQPPAKTNSRPEASPRRGFGAP